MDYDFYYYFGNNGADPQDIESALAYDNIENDNDNDKLYFLPPYTAINRIYETTKKKKLFQIISFICSKLIADDAHLCCPDLENIKVICDCTHNSSLSLYKKFKYIGVPLQRSNESVNFEYILTSWAKSHGKREQVNIESRKKC